MAILVQSNKKPSVSFPSQTGTIVTFDSQYAGLPLKSCVVDFENETGIDSLDFSATGKNIGNKDLFVRGTINGNGADSTSSWRLRSPFIPVKPDTSYSIMCNSEVNIYEIHKYGANGEYYGYNAINAPSNVYNFPSNVYYTKILIRYSNNKEIYVTDLTQFQIAESETALPYEPFGTYTTIQIGSTVYGGEYDARTGVLTVTHEGVDLGTLNWNRYTNPKKTYFRTANEISDCIKSTSVNKTYGLTCSNYVEGSWTNVVDGNGYDLQFTLGWDHNSYIAIHDDSKSEMTAADFKTAMNGVQLMYPLATPTTIQLPPCPIDTLEGVNNIWADTGDTTLQYIKIGG